MPLLRRRWVAAAGLGLAGAVVAAVFWPAPAERAARGKRLIDSALPRYRYAERHQTRICAPPERIVAAVRHVLSEETRWSMLDPGFALAAETADELLFEKPNAAMNFTIGGAPFGCKMVTTETRRQVAGRPWSALLRRIWLDAIRRRAEAK